METTTNFYLGVPIRFTLPKADMFGHKQADATKVEYRTNVPGLTVVDGILKGTPTGSGDFFAETRATNSDGVAVCKINIRVVEPADRKVLNDPNAGAPSWEACATINAGIATDGEGNIHVTHPDGRIDVHYKTMEGYWKAVAQAAEADKHRLEADNKSLRYQVKHLEECLNNLSVEHARVVEAVDKAIRPNG